MDSIGIVFPRLFAESSTLAVESLGLASYDPAPVPLRSRQGYSTKKPGFRKESGLVVSDRDDGLGRSIPPPLFFGQSLDLNLPVEVFQLALLVGLDAVGGQREQGFNADAAAHGGH